MPTKPRGAAEPAPPADAPPLPVDDTPADEQFVTDVDDVDQTAEPTAAEERLRAAQADSRRLEDVPAREETPAQRVARLRAELAELERNDAGVERAEPTHVLVLADGSTVETVSPGATHHAVEEGGPAIPVISRFELARKEV